MSDHGLHLARHLLLTGAADRASDVLDSLPPESLDAPEFWRLRTSVAHAREDVDGALTAARAGLARFPADAELRILAARLLVERDELVAAERLLLETLADDPEDVEALCWYARVVAMAGQDGKARRLVERAASIEPEAGEVLVARWHLAHLSGDHAGRAEAAAALARFSDGDPRTVALLGLEAAERGDVGTSHELFTRAARGDIRVVDVVGADTLRDLRLAAHPLMWPLRPVQRFGPVAVWITCVGAIALLAASGARRAAGLMAMGWIAWVLYTWIAPPLVRRVIGGRR